MSVEHATTGAWLSLVLLVITFPLWIGPYMLYQWVKRTRTPGDAG